MKIIKNIAHAFWVFLLAAMLFACAPVAQPTPEAQAEPEATAPLQEQVAEKAEVQPQPQPAVDTQQATVLEEGQLPVRFRQPAYMVKEPGTAQEMGLEVDEEIVIRVGADISSTSGPVALRDILKRLALLKSMNVSWASDVDQFALVDVGIRAEDDFFQAIDNILRQMDYFHEVKDNTIVVKYRETRKFHIAMPFMTYRYTNEVGGDVIGASGESNVKGNIQLKSSDNLFDIWENIKTNLDQILEIWEETIPTTAAAEATALAEGEAAPMTITRRNVQGGKGYYTIDKPIGLITITAPRPLVEKIALYLNNLKKELYKQISIEAKILEVTLTENSTKGIDWTGVLQSKNIHFELFGSGTGGSTASTTLIYPGSNRVISAVSVENPFTFILDAIEEQGKTKILANPRISVMNGQPALISVGENQAFIEKVETRVDEGVVSTTVKTSTVLSGLGLAVVATVMENDEIILSMTPVTSDLINIDEREFEGIVVQLPQVALREMSTTVRIKSGEMLMVGGLIDNDEKKDDTKIPILGDIPYINKLFKSETIDNTKKELVILLLPKII